MQSEFTSTLLCLATQRGPVFSHMQVSKRMRNACNHDLAGDSHVAYISTHELACSPSCEFKQEMKQHRRRSGFQCTALVAYWLSIYRRFGTLCVGEVRSSTSA